MSGFANPNFTLVELSNHGTLLGFIDQESVSKPARIMISADCPKASLGVEMTMFSQLILVAVFDSFEEINFTVSMKSSTELSLSRLVNCCNFETNDSIAKIPLLNRSSSAIN